MSEPSQKYSAVLVFVFSAATLLLEILLIKTLNVLLNSTAGFLLLSLALFYLCAAGALLHFLAEVKNVSAEKIFNFATFGFTFVATLSLPLLRILSLSTSLKVNESFGVSLGVIALMSLPFLLSGLCVLILLNRNSGKEFHTLYMLDMFGIVAAAFLPRLLISLLGPEQLMATALIIVSLILVGFFRKKFSSTLKFAFGAIVLINIAVLIGVSSNTHIRPYINKYMPRQLEPEKIEFSVWDPIARIDVVDFSNLPGQKGINEKSQATKYVFYDGGTIGTNIYPYNGDALGLRARFKEDPTKHFLRLGTVASHWLKQDSNYKAYLFGVGAGQELKAALVFGAQKVYANELVQSVVDLSQTTYAFYNGNIFNSDKVQILVGDGRLQLKSLNEKFDIIQIFSNYLSANMSSGLSSFQVSYLFTVESMKEYLDHLEPDGILQINQFDHGRLLKVLAEAWKLENPYFAEFKDHIYVIQSHDRRDILPTILFKKSKFTEKEDGKIKELFSIEEKKEFFIAESPFLKDRPPILQLKHRNNPISDFVATDDRPFFGSDKTLWFNFYGVNKWAYGLMFILILIVSIAFLLPHKMKSTVKKDGLSLVFYVLCGFIYILVQVSFIQMVIKNLNWPDLAFSLVVGGMAAGTGIFNLFLNSAKRNISFRFIFFLNGLFVLSSCFIFMFLDFISGLNNLLACLNFFLTFAILGVLGGSYFSYAIWKLKKIDAGIPIHLAWLFNGLGILLGSFVMHFLFLNFGHQRVLVGSGILNFFGLLILVALYKKRVPSIS